jgi:hypothetical protein
MLNIKKEFDLIDLFLSKKKKLIDLLATNLLKYECDY